MTFLSEMLGEENAAKVREHQAKTMTPRTLTECLEGQFSGFCHNEINHKLRTLHPDVAEQVRSMLLRAYQEGAYQGLAFGKRQAVQVMEEMAMEIVSWTKPLPPVVPTTPSWTHGVFKPR